MTSRTARDASSFYATSQSRFQESFRAWKRELPFIRPYYAVKCNPDEHLMSWLASYGAGFDCASAREVRLAQQATAGTSKKPDILFANPCKRVDEMFSANLAGVRTTVVDSHEEIEKLYTNKWRGDALVRIRVEDSGSKMPFSAKFGASPADLSNLAAFAALKGVRLSGISFHVGSGCETPEQYKNAIRAADDGVAVLAAEGHREAATIDIGGGFTRETFEASAVAIREGAAACRANRRFVAEPGRLFAQTSHDLFVRVIGKKPAVGGAARCGFRYTLDESLYGQFSCIPYDHAQPRWIRVRSEEEPERARKPAVLYGRTCDSVDFIAAAAEAEELEEGDWLWFPHMGAYTTVTSTEFNGFPKPPSRVLEAHGAVQLPSPGEFSEESWPRGLQYVSAIKIPEMR